MTGEKLESEEKEKKKTLLFPDLQSKAG